MPGTSLCSLVFALKQVFFLPLHNDFDNFGECPFYFVMFLYCGIEPGLKSDLVQSNSSILMLIVIFGLFAYEVFLLSFSLVV